MNRAKVTFAACVIAGQFAVCDSAYANLFGDQFDITGDADGNPIAFYGINAIGGFPIIGQSQTIYARLDEDVLSFESGQACSSDCAHGEITFTDTTHADILNVTIGQLSDVTGFSAADIKFTADTVSVTFPPGITWAHPGAEIDLDIEDANPVPEPASVAMLGTGILALGFIGWRRRRSANLALLEMTETKAGK